MKDLFESMANDFKPKNALITKEMNEINNLKEQYNLGKLTLAELVDKSFESGEIKSETRCADQLDIARTVIRDLLNEKKMLIEVMDECRKVLEIIQS